VKVLPFIIVFAACSHQAGPPSAQSQTQTKPESSTTEQAFTGIYQEAVWGKNEAGVGNSGTGSTEQSTRDYRSLLQRVLAEKGIRSVVDAGCGDWEFSQLIDWKGIDYKGYDIVASVVEGDKQRFGAPQVQFFVGDIVHDDLPSADLLISKHVLQHLPDKDVQTFLEKQLPKYKYALITNGVDSTTKSADHKTDIQPGGYRPLDITKPPFGIHAEPVLTYNDGHHWHRVWLVTR
jgi:SAM-dependent methyltransferase